MTSDVSPPGTDGIELRKLRSLVADTHAIVWEADARTMAFTFVSEGMTSILGYSPQQWLADPAFWTDHIHPDDRERTVSRIHRASMSGSRFDAEYRFIAKDGSTVWLRDVGHTVSDENGQPNLIRGLMTDITANKTLEGTRGEAEERFRRVAEGLPAIVYLEQVEEDPSKLGRMLYVSPRVEQILGFTPSEWTEDPVSWLRQFHPDDRERLREAYELAARTGEPLSANYRMYSRDGRVVWFRDEAVLVRDEHGNPSYWQGIMYDVTEQKRVTEHARETEARYRALLEQLPAIVYSEDVATARLRFVYVNSKLEELLGIKPQEWLLDPGLWLETVHPDDRDAARAARDRARDTGGPFRAEYRMTARSGRVLWFHDEGLLVHDQAGRPAYRQGVMIDITRTKNAEARVAEAQERYSSLAESTPTITYIDSLEGPAATLYISPATTELLGYTPQDWYDDPGLWAKIVHPDDRDPNRIVSTEGPVDSILRLRAADGHLVWVHDQARIVTDLQGNPKYWQGTLVDVTAHKRTQELEHDLARERDTAEQLRAADEMKNTFLQAVSHDLRTPLAAILGLALTLEREDLFLDMDEARDMAHRIAHNARKLDGIVSDLLDLDRLTRGIVEPDFDVIDVGETVRALVGNSEVAAGKTLELETVSLEIPADAAMVERIVENLLGNAVKHTPRESRIWVRVEGEEGGVLIVVEDDGPGVPQEEQLEIFDAFRQGETGPMVSGAGIGLALVARFAELHDGRAWVEDRAGGGASFRVFLSAHPMGYVPGSRYAVGEDSEANHA